MEIIVRGQHFSVPDHVEERAREKLARLAHYLPLLADAAVEVDVANERAKEPELRYAVRVIVHGHGVHLRAEAHASRPEAAVDRAARALTGQARRHKQRLYGRGRKSAAKQIAVSGGDEGTEPSLARALGRVKHFPMKPMTTAEALEQMEALGHDFYLFFDADADQVALVYRRRAGDFGLILPELP